MDKKKIIDPTPPRSIPDEYCHFAVNRVLGLPQAHAYNKSADYGDMITQMFTWRSSEEGSSFWSVVADALDNGIPISDEVRTRLCNYQALYFDIINESRQLLIEADERYNKLQAKNKELVDEIKAIDELLQESDDA